MLNGIYGLTALLALVEGGVRERLVALLPIGFVAVRVIVRRRATVLAGIPTTVGRPPTTATSRAGGA